MTRRQLDLQSRLIGRILADDTNYVFEGMCLFLDIPQTPRRNGPRHSLEMFFVAASHEIDEFTQQCDIAANVLENGLPSGQIRYRRR